MKNLLDYTLRELKDISISIDELYNKVSQITIEEKQKPCGKHNKECCKNCKWYNKGVKNMAYCAVNPDVSSVNPKEEKCEKYEGE